MVFKLVDTGGSSLGCKSNTAAFTVLMEPPFEVVQIFGDNPIAWSTSKSAKGFFFSFKNFFGGRKKLPNEARPTRSEVLLRAAQHSLCRR